MSAGRLRPTFSVALKPDRKTAIEAIRDRLALEDRFEGRWMGKGRWAEIHVPANDRRLWSPHLSIRVDPTEDATDGSTLFGRFAPNPEVWTFLMFLYFAVAFLVVLGAIFGYVQWASNEPSWGYWAVWIGLPIIGMIHVAGAVGRRLGQDQMVTLKAELDEVIEPLL